MGEPGRSQALRSTAADQRYKPLRGQHVPVVYRTTSRKKTQNTEAMQYESTCERFLISKAPTLLQEVVLRRDGGRDKIGRSIGAGLHKHVVPTPQWNTVSWCLL